MWIYLLDLLSTIFPIYEIGRADISTASTITRLLSVAVAPVPVLLLVRIGRADFCNQPVPNKVAPVVLLVHPSIGP